MQLAQLVHLLLHGEHLGADLLLEGHVLRTDAAKVASKAILDIAIS